MARPLICQGCNEKIRWWQKRTLYSRYGWLHTGVRCFGFAVEKDVNN